MGWHVKVACYIFILIPPLNDYCDLASIEVIAVEFERLCTAFKPRIDIRRMSDSQNKTTVVSLVRLVQANVRAPRVQVLDNAVAQVFHDAVDFCSCRQDRAVKRD
jgi:hypothetical protein